MSGKRRRFTAEFKARVVRAALREEWLSRYFAYYNHQRRHSGLGRMTPASVYGLEPPQGVEDLFAHTADRGIIVRGGGSSIAANAAVAPVALRAPSATADGI